MHRPHVRLEVSAYDSGDGQVFGQVKRATVDGVDWPVHSTTIETTASGLTSITLGFYGSIEIVPAEKAAA